MNISDMCGHMPIDHAENKCRNSNGSRYVPCLSVSTGQAAAFSSVQRQLISPECSLLTTGCVQDAYLASYCIGSLCSLLFVTASVVCDIHLSIWDNFRWAGPDQILHRDVGRGVRPPCTPQLECPNAPVIPWTLLKGGKAFRQVF